MNNFIETIEKYGFDNRSFDCYYIGYLNQAIKNGWSNQQLNKIVLDYEEATKYLQECR